MDRQNWRMDFVTSGEFLAFFGLGNVDSEGRGRLVTGLLPIWTIAMLPGWKPER